MKIVLTYIVCGVAWLSACFGGGDEANRGQLTIQNNTSFTLIPDKIQVYADRGRSKGCNIYIDDFPEIPAGQRITHGYQGASNCLYWKKDGVNYKFLMKLRRPGEKDKELFIAEVNVLKPEDNQWSEPFGADDEAAHYRETLRIKANDTILEEKPGVIFYQGVRRIRGGTESNWRIDEIREAGGTLVDV